MLAGREPEGTNMYPVICQRSVPVVEIYNIVLLYFKVYTALESCLFPLLNVSDKKKIYSVQQSIVVIFMCFFDQVVSMNTNSFCGLIHKRTKSP